jgi:hypothetical protein
MRLANSNYIGGVLKAVIFVALVAVVIYFVTRAIERGIAARPGPPKRPRRPLGPDDDQDFIWGLNKKRRHPEE